jgi:alpha-1,6-mannosyltransferase
MDMQKKISSLRVAPLKVAIPVFGVTSALIYAANWRHQPYEGTHVFLFKFMVISALYLISVYLVVKYRADTSRAKSLVLMILLFGVLFRAVLVMDAPKLSSDIYRYVWDGRVQAQGINPYIHAPSDRALVPLRDKEVYPLINRQDYPTIYPAGAQLFFFLSRVVGGSSVAGLKIILTFFDILTMILLVELLNAYRLDRARVLIYAWNPLVVYEIAQSGHLEGLTVFLIVSALYLHATGRRTSGVISLSLAASTKLFPALLLPAFLGRGERVKGLLVFTSCLTVLYLPFMSAGSRIAGFLPDYLNNPYESFNLGLKQLIMTFFPGVSYSFLSGIFLGILFAAGFFFFFKDKKELQVPRYAYLLVSLMIIFAPASLHPWYVVWLVPFLAFYPTAAWLIFSCALSLSYLKYVQSEGMMPSWVLYLEYVPLYALLITGYLIKTFRNRSMFSDETTGASMIKKTFDSSCREENLPDEV